MDLLPHILHVGHYHMDGFCAVSPASQHTYNTHTHMVRARAWAITQHYLLGAYGWRDVPVWQQHPTADLPLLCMTDKPAFHDRSELQAFQHTYTTRTYTHNTQTNTLNAAWVVSALQEAGHWDLLCRYVHEEYKRKGLHFPCASTFGPPPAEVWGAELVQQETEGSKEAKEQPTPVSSSLQPVLGNRQFEPAAVVGKQAFMLTEQDPSSTVHVPNRPCSWPELERSGYKDAHATKVQQSIMSNAPLRVRRSRRCQHPCWMQHTRTRVGLRSVRHMCRLTATSSSRNRSRGTCGQRHSSRSSRRSRRTAQPMCLMDRRCGLWSPSHRSCSSSWLQSRLCSR
jgi:hypothetical protein